MLECEGRWFDKPAGLDAAAQALRRLRGRSHRLISAAAVVEAGVPPWSHTAVASLTVRDFTDDFLAGYLERVGPEVCSSVGAYQLEGPGVQLFSAIEGDYFCILGLPLLPLLDHLRSRGVIGQ
jgi:septum formation protein